jgi:hypothetical protein
MAYADDFYGLTQIIEDDQNNLRVNWDREDPRQPRSAVLLFTPNMANTEDHHHIELTRERAIKLRDWLNEFLNDPNRLP